MEITLNTAEQKLAVYISKARDQFCKNNDVGNKRQIKNKTDQEVHLEGAGAELAFCKIMNVYPDTDTRSFGISDTTTPKIGKVDVKSTDYSNGRLIAPHWKKIKNDLPDAYALMVGKFPTYKFVGWAKANELLNEQNVCDLGHCKTFALKQNQLRSPETAINN